MRTKKTKSPAPKSRMTTSEAREIGTFDETDGAPRARSLEAPRAKRRAATPLTKGRKPAKAQAKATAQPKAAAQPKARAKPGKQKLSAVGRGKTVLGLERGAAKSTHVANPKRSTAEQASKRGGARSVDGRAARG